MKFWKWILPALLAAGLVVGGMGPLSAEQKSAQQSSAQQKEVLVSKKVAAAPATDGTVDNTWKSAAALKATVVDGKNLPAGSTEVTMRSVYSGDTIYFMFQYADPDQSFRRSPWVKQADGSWKKLTDPDDKGGDNNRYYEDKFAVIWNISSPAFEQSGCMSVCHTGEGKPYGNKYTATAGERLDLWHAKSVRGAASLGQIDDQYVDNTRYDPEKFPEAGRKSDPKTGGGYYDNVTDDKKGPKFGLKGNKPAPPYWILDAEKEPIDAPKYKAGDEVPGVVVAPFAGDRADISGAMVWKNGVWTVVMKRKLVTGSEYDVQFDNLKKKYAFGMAVFDNAQVRHAYLPGVLQLAFE